MSEADKMLCNEGFEIFNYIRFLDYFHKYLKIYIQFDKKEHKVELCGADKDKYEVNLFINIAINLKRKELGWI